jgi:hypothetical protein
LSVETHEGDGENETTTTPGVVSFTTSNRIMPSTRARRAERDPLAISRARRDHQSTTP